MIVSPDRKTLASVIDARGEPLRGGRAASDVSGPPVRPRKRKLRVVLLGYGAINSCVALLLAQSRPDIELVGVITRSRGRPAAPLLSRVPVIEKPTELEAVAPDIVLEAASGEAVAAWGVAALRAASRLAVSSAGALSDDALRSELLEAARRSGSQMVLSPGALAGVDALAAARRRHLRSVRHRIIKPPAAWPATCFEQAGSSAERQILFQGSARKAAQQFPRNANVVVVSALAGLGLDDTLVEMVSDPSVTRNCHQISATGDFGSLESVIQNHPSPFNPRSSDQAALALVRLVENEVDGIVI